MIFHFSVQKNKVAKNYADIQQFDDLRI